MVHLLAPLALVAGLVHAPHDDELATPFSHRTSGWASSSSCHACHPDHHASWARTFHRTMTQEANAASVRGALRSPD